ncbi:MAG: S1C family serine protease [Myxococcales bacterium]|nr:S1C family serine protease [Myxococcales bacterium]MDH5567389.1 S1C family serine protease [Myxococcales bacterium]
MACSSGCLALALACAGTPPPLEKPIGAPSPIHLQQRGSPPIYFEQIMFRIAAGEKIATVYEQRSQRQLAEETWDGRLKGTDEYNIAIADRLAMFGYDAVDPADALFQDGAITTRFRLAAVLTDIHIRSFVLRRTPFSREGNPDPARGIPAGKGALQPRYLGIRQEVSLELEFKLYDAAVKRVIYERSFRGYGMDQGPTGAIAIDDAVRNAVDFLLSDPDFVWTVTESPTTRIDTPPAIGISACRVNATVDVPRDLESVLEAVVIVRSGRSVGSGVIVSDDGYVLTAAHVAPEGSQPVVQLASGSAFEATVERADWSGDVALLKIPGRGHRCLRPSEASLPSIGSEIYAIGSPGGERFPRSVTRGIVSAHRDDRGRLLIQTDASINHGNSGGPLVDSSGRVLGIVTSKTFDLGMEGVAFGLPVGEARELLAIEWE